MRHIVCLLLLLQTAVFCGEARPKTEEILPDSTLAALLVPDLAAARTAAGKTKLAEMYAQPEMQEFLKPALDQLRKTYATLRTKNPLLPDLSDIDTGLFSGEIAAAVYARPGDLQNPYGVLLTVLPKDPEAFKRLVPANMRPMLQEGLNMPLGAKPSDASLAFSNGRLMLAAPQADMAGFVAKTKEAAANAKSLAVSPPYIAAKKKLNSAVMWLYAQPARAAKYALEEAPVAANIESKKIQAILKTVGMDGFTTLALGLGFSETDPVGEAYMAFSAPPKDGLFALMTSTTPVDPANMNIAAVDAPYVAAGHFNVAGVIPFLTKLAQAANPELIEAIGHFELVSREFFKFDIQKDVLENLGSEIVVAQTALDTSAPLSFMPGMAISVPVKNVEKLQDCLAKVGVAARQNEKMGLKLKQIVHRGKTIFYFSGTVFSGPAAFCFIENRMLICTSVNAARRTIEQLEKKDNILSNKQFLESMARVQGKPLDPKALPAAFSYSIDNGSGSGTLLMTGVGLLGGTAIISGLAEIPAIPGGAPVLQVPAGNGSIDANEKAAAAACHAFAEAQEIYRRTDYDKDGVLEYAQALKGDNSLLENKAGQADIALIDADMAAAEGNPDGKANYAGYRFKVLKGQEETPTDPKRSYIVKDNMTLGYALVAYPAQYGTSGKKTLQINTTGTVYARDMGADTAAKVAKLESFSIDKSWTIVEPAEPEIENDPLNEFGELGEFLKRPAGEAMLSVAQSIDLGLWPDEAFFIKHRRPTASVSIIDPDGIYTRTELPTPGPVSASSIQASTFVFGTAVIAAVAVPSLLRSRMAANETAAAASCKAYAEAQEIYRRTDFDGDGALEYAQAFKGNNSLLEKTAGAGDIALVDRTFAFAEGKPGEATPKAGYLYKILKAQGAHAAGGKKSYLVKDNMTLGYALVAYPATYDSTGRNTFLINHNGTIFQADLGPGTHAMVEEMTEFDPDPAIWVPTE